MRCDIQTITVHETGIIVIGRFFKTENTGYIEITWKRIIFFPLEIISKSFLMQTHENLNCGVDLATSLLI